MARRPLALIILDGFGDGPPGPWNAISVAAPPFLRSLEASCPRGQLWTSGECVGLPNGLMGNSEVGHMNLGAGRIVWQDITRIDLAIREGRLQDNDALLAAARHVRDHGSTLHLIGLVSDGGVHSSDRHLRALLSLYHEQGVPPERCAVHALLDGRDTPPRSAERYVGEVEDFLAEQRCGRVASVIGRYYAMDRDCRWERVERAWRCLVAGEGETAPSGREAVRAAYRRGENDEFVQPTVVGDRGRHRVSGDDAVVFFNFRADRARELTLAFRDPHFDGFERPAGAPRPCFVSLTRYRKDFPDLGVRDAFAPQSLDRLFTNVIADAGLTQLRIAETEKYAHVTYFFSGGVEEPERLEQRILVPSPRVATYDLQPEMSAPEVTDRLVAEIAADRFDVVVLNLANPDMVGHTGRLDAAVEAVRAVDAALSRIVPAIVERGGTALITADHGNCELMWDEERNCPHTAHTTNPVPLILAGRRFRGAKLREGGILADVSPTLLDILDLPQPAEMTARTLLEK